MAVKVNQFTPNKEQQHRRTSVGASVNSRPLNKSKRRSFKKYRGQGKHR
jgi:hypothetical protein